MQTHFISLCGDYGMSAVPAASVLAMMGAFDFVGTILSGWLSDRYDNRKLLFWYYSPALYTAGAACLLAALLVMAIRRPGAPVLTPSVAPQ